ncbi:MAG TPA: ester cyclase [Ktedonobacterales bacterium]|jgi:predicted ester cyclase
MSAEANKALIRQLIEEVINQGNLALIDDLFDAAFVDRSAPDQPPGLAGVREYIAAARAGFPDLHASIEDLIAEGDKVVVRTTWRGMHQGMYEGVAPTGKQVTRTMIQIFRVTNGKLAEEWNEGPGLLL